MTSFTERLNEPEDKCKCYAPPFYYIDYGISFLGIDKTNGRFADRDNSNLCLLRHKMG